MWPQVERFLTTPDQASPEARTATVALVAVRTALKDLWRRGQRGWPARFPVVQVPNAPLLFALGAWLVAAHTTSTTHAYSRAAFYAGLAAWAWAEAASGDNWFRRALGVGGLVYVVAKLGVAFGA